MTTVREIQRRSRNNSKIQSDKRVLSTIMYLVDEFRNLKRNVQTK